MSVDVGQSFDCVECYENWMLGILGGTLAVYKSLVYRMLVAKCPDCQNRECDKALYHGNECEYGD